MAETIEFSFGLDASPSESDPKDGIDLAFSSLEKTRGGDRSYRLTDLEGCGLSGVWLN